MRKFLLTTVLSLGMLMPVAAQKNEVWVLNFYSTKHPGETSPYLHKAFTSSKECDDYLQENIKKEGTELNHVLESLIEIETEGHPGEDFIINVRCEQPKT